MSRPLKFGLGIGAALVFAIAVAAIFVYASLDSLIETAVEDIGSEATKARVEVAEVDVSPTSGEGALRGLTVGNPSGFSTPRAFSLGEVSIKLDVDTVADDLIVIKEIVIAAPEVTYEVGPGGSNVDAIKKNVDAFAGTEKREARRAGDGGEGPKLVIEHLYIRRGKVNVSHSALGGRTLSAPLPDLYLTDIGKDKGGTGPGEAIETVLAALSQGIGKSVATLNLDKALGLVEGAKGLEGAIQKSKDGIGGAVKGFLGGANE